MKHIDEARLESDLEYRFNYLAAFMDFGPDDIARIHASAAFLAEQVPSLVDAVYAQLQKFDATWRHFLPTQGGYEGKLAPNLEQLTADHEVIRFRKQHLARYLTRLVTMPYDHKMVQYLDFVGKMHTEEAGSSQVNVPLVQMNALLGFVADALILAILGSRQPRDQQHLTVRAFNKLLWLQNDLINRHYQSGGKSRSD